MILAWIRSLDECKVRSFTRLTRPHPRPLTLFSATFEPLCAVGLISSFLMHGVSRSVLEVSYPIAWTTDRAHEFLLDIVISLLVYSDAAYRPGPTPLSYKMAYYLQLSDGPRVVNHPSAYMSNGHSCKVPSRARWYNYFAGLPRFVQLSPAAFLALVSGALNRHHFFHGSSQPAPLPHKHHNKEAALARSSLIHVEDPTGLLVFEAALYSPYSCRGIITSYVLLGWLVVGAGRSGYAHRGKRE